MKKIPLLLTAITAVLSLCFTCDDADVIPCHRSIAFRNDSERAVYVSWGWARDYENFEQGDLRGAIDRVQGGRTEPGEENWSAIAVGKGACLEGKGIGIYLYVFDAEVYETLSWEEISENDLFLRYFLITYQELDKADWNFSFM